MAFSFSRFGQGNGSPSGEGPISWITRLFTGSDDHERCAVIGLQKWTRWKAWTRPKGDHVSVVFNTTRIGAWIVGGIEDRSVQDNSFHDRLTTRQAHGRRAISHPKSSDSAVIRTLPVSPPSHSGGHLTMQEGHLASRIADLRADHHQRVADRRKSVLLNASTTPLGSPPTRRTNPRRTHGSGRPSKSGRPARPASRHMRRPACRSATCGN